MAKKKITVRDVMGAVSVIAVMIAVPIWEIFKEIFSNVGVVRGMVTFVKGLDRIREIRRYKQQEAMQSCECAIGKPCIMEKHRQQK